MMTQFNIYVRVQVFLSQENVKYLSQFSFGIKSPFLYSIYQHNAKDTPFPKKYKDSKINIIIFFADI